MMVINPWQDLADAIILQAFEDYLAALITLDKEIETKDDEKKYITARKRKREVERFYKSEWYRTLTDIDPLPVKKHAKAQAARELWIRENIAPVKTVTISPIWFNRVKSGEITEIYKANTKYHTEQYGKYEGQAVNMRIRSGYNRIDPEIFCEILTQKREGKEDWGAKPGKTYWAFEIKKILEVKE